MRRAALFPIALAIAAAGCGAGPDAPAPGETETVCADSFCIAYPTGWDVVESTGEFISFSHPLGDGKALATAAPLNMEALANAAGETWPILTEDVARAFWSLIDGGDAELVNVRTIADGSVSTVGTISTGRLWYYLVPTGISEAVGLEVRGPNGTWEAHAELFFAGVDPIE
jgi:hypothetical protein